MRPLIALTLAQPTPDRVGSNRLYREALERAGADVLEVYPGDQLPVDIDGLLLAGGGDVDPARYGQPNTAADKIDSQRDELELALAHRVIDDDLPVLGICRGFQVLNVAFGGKLVQDVADHRPAEPDGVVRHEGVLPRAGSRLAAAVGDAPLTVNSRHHQAVIAETLGSRLLATAHVHELVEAFEATDKHWVVGVQWHPERTREVSPAAVRIFDAFVAQAAATTRTAR
jgi:gamma-glutamyl-gamma-aminobutyrate hydrolase PuuD